MLSKSAARTFFLVGTAVCAGSFLLLTMDTLKKVPAQTHADQITAQVKRGKQLWDQNNCMGCHTLFGEGAYYAPELTKVYERRGGEFIKAMIKNPQQMYPNERKMVKYDFSEEDLNSIVEFFKWAGKVDLNGWPPRPDLGRVASTSGAPIASQTKRPQIFNQMCIACHSLQGQGANVGPSLDRVGSRLTRDQLVSWLRDPQAYKPGAKMPKLPLSETDITELAAFLSTLKDGAQQ